MLQTLPAYRLPNGILKNEIQVILDAGVELKTGVHVASAGGLLGEGYQAVFAAVGVLSAVQAAERREEVALARGGERHARVAQQQRNTWRNLEAGPPWSCRSPAFLRL